MVVYDSELADNMASIHFEAILQENVNPLVNLGEKQAAKVQKNVHRRFFNWHRTHPGKRYVKREATVEVIDKKKRISLVGPYHLASYMDGVPIQFHYT